MRVFGIVLIVVGAIWLGIAFNMDTSIESPSGGLYGLPERVENLGLIAQRQNHLFVSGLIILIGVLLAIFGGRINVRAQQSASPAPIAKPAVAAPENRDLSSDAYRLWLADAYGIKRNEVFDRFVFGEQTFGTLDDALRHAHSLELVKLEAAKAARQQAEEQRQLADERLQRWKEEQDARWQRDKPKVIAGVAIGAPLLIAAGWYLVHMALEQNAKEMAERAAVDAKLQKDAEDAGFTIIDEASGVTRKQVKSGDAEDDNIWCNSGTGDLVTYTVQKSVKEVVAFYDGKLKDGTDTYTAATDDSANRLYDGPTHARFDMGAYGSGGSTTVYLCKLAASQ